MLGEQVVLASDKPLEERQMLLGPGVSQCDERISPQPARIVAGHVEPIELVDHRLPVAFEPLHEIDMPA